VSVFTVPFLFGLDVIVDDCREENFLRSYREVLRRDPQGGWYIQVNKYHIPQKYLDN
jgi:hypothetical protein